MTPGNSDVADWWSTAIIDMEPGRIAFRGTEIQDLIGNVSFPEMIWRMTRTDQPTPGQIRLFDASLVSAVDHGPQAPSIATARMAVTCGLPLNNAMASAVNTLGNMHAGAGEQAVELYHRIDGFDGPIGAVLEAVSEGIRLNGAGRFHSVLG